MKKFILFVCAMLIGLSVSAQKTYKVGDYYNENGKEGVVFWVDESGEHGKIVSMKESVRRWARKSENSKLIGTNDRTDGEKNLAVVRQIPGWKRKYPAFAWCENLGEGWYLPAVEEVEIIGKNREQIDRSLEKQGAKKIRLVNDVLDFQHWSSTEDPDKSEYFCGAYSVFFILENADDSFQDIKNGEIHGWAKFWRKVTVRAISKF